MNRSNTTLKGPGTPMRNALVLSIPLHEGVIRAASLKALPPHTINAEGNAARAAVVLPDSRIHGAGVGRAVGADHVSSHILSGIKGYGVGDAELAADGSAGSKVHGPRDDGRRSRKDGEDWVGGETRLDRH